jgi:hypothetical protein
MPYTMQDFLREELEELTPEQRMKGLTIQQRLEGLTPLEILESCTKSEIEAYLATLNKKTKKKSKRKSD